MIKTLVQQHALFTSRQMSPALQHFSLPLNSARAASSSSSSSPIASSSRHHLATGPPLAALDRRSFTHTSSTNPLTTLHTHRQIQLRRSKARPLPFAIPPHHRTLATYAPAITSKPDNPEEPNVYKSGDPTILLTDRAVKQLLKIAAKEKDKADRLGLRIAVEPGGCHGYQYKMELEEAESGQEEGPGEEDDFRFQPTPLDSSSGILPLPILIDSISLTLLRGSTIDYVTELIGSQFAIKDNPQAKGAGCGCGVSWEPIV